MEKKKLEKRSETSEKKMFLQVVGEALGGVFGPTNHPKKYYSHEVTTFSKKQNFRRIKFRIEGSIRNKKTSRIRAKLN